MTSGSLMIKFCCKWKQFWALNILVIFFLLLKDGSYQTCEDKNN